MRPATVASSSNTSKPGGRRLPKRRSEPQATRVRPRSRGHLRGVGRSAARAAPAWADAYSNYSLLWKQQRSVIDNLPVHHRGESSADSCRQAQRTGRTEEVAQHLDRMLTLMKGTPPVRGNGTTVEGEPRECRDHQSDVQGMPQPWASVVDTCVAAKMMVVTSTSIIAMRSPDDRAPIRGAQSL
jgi:hypothetical protein